MRKKIVTTICAICILGVGAFYYHSVYGSEPIKGNKESVQDKKKAHTKWRERKEEKEYYAYIDDSDPYKVWIGDKETKKEFSIQVEDEEQKINAVMETEWVTKEQLGIISHIDPSMSYFCIYDVEKKTFLNGTYGFDFQWVNQDIDTFVYAVASPHFKQQKGNEIVKNRKEEILYTTREGEEIEEIQLSPDGEYIGIVTYEKNGEQYDLILIDRDGKVKKEEKLKGFPMEAGWTSKNVFVVDGQTYTIYNEKE